MIQPFSKELSAEIFSHIKNAKKILMHCHPNPDGDSLGSTLGMKHALTSIGKDVTVIKGDSALPHYLKALPGYDSIVLKNIFEVDLSEYDLFLVLDSGSQEQISKLGPVTFPSGLKTIIIDHHKSNIGFADINMIDISSPAAAQVVYYFLEANGIVPTKESALCLFIGMYTDTGGFKYRPVNSQTLAAASKLAEIAPDYPDIIFQMENNNTKGRLVVQGLLIQSIQTHFNNHVAFASLSQEDIKAHNITDDETGGIDITNYMKSVVGWNICVSFVERVPGFIKMSFRTRDTVLYDVSKIAVAIGGGGHAASAGAQLPGTIAEVQEKVLKTLPEVYPDLK